MEDTVLTEELDQAPRKKLRPELIMAIIAGILAVLTLVLTLVSLPEIMNPMRISLIFRGWKQSHKEDAVNPCATSLLLSSFNC